MKRAMTAIVGVASMWGLVACGSSGPSASQFVDQIDTVCRTLGRDLAALDAPTTLDAMGTFSAKASKSYEDALLSMKKIAVPSSGSLVKNARDLLGNLDDQITLLDAISTAAGKGDQVTVDDKVAKFKTLESSDSDLADSLGATRCALDPLFAGKVTPDTVPATEPPVTEPPVTEPPVTEPPATLPPETTPASATNKTTIQLSPQLLPVAGYTFADTDPSLVETFASLLDLSPQTQVVDGKVAGIEITNSSGAMFTRVFVFLPTDSLSSSALVELIPTLSGGATTTPAKLGGLDGVEYQSSNGSFWFIASDSISASHIIVWATAKTASGLDTSVTVFLKSLPQ